MSSLRNISLIQGLPFEQSPIEDITDKLPVNPNYTWETLCGRRDLNDLTDIAVHHTASPKKDNITPYRHAVNHINSTKIHPKGSPGFPYHVYIKNGKIYQGNDLRTFTYGVSAHNDFTVHISVEGRYDPGHDTLSKEDRNALYAAILTVKACLPNFKCIKAHKEYTPTACPGFSIDEVRKDIAAIEQRMNRDDVKWSSKMDKCSPLRNEIAFMLNNVVNKGEKDQDAQKSMKKLMKLYDFMKQSGMLPPRAP